jgi:hypothetical protein
MSRNTVWQVLRRRIRIETYKFTVIHKLELEDCPKWKHFWKTLQTEMDNDETTAQNPEFNDKAAFHTSSKVNPHNLHVCGTETHATLQHQTDLPNGNIYLAMSRSQVYCPANCQWK